MSTEPRRRDFIRTAAVGAASPMLAAAWPQRSPNDTVNVAVVGFHGRGSAHIQAYARMQNVRIAALCDADERLFPQAVANVEKMAGYRPDTEFDIRRLLERKDIDAVSIATPDYWHALMTIWACQAGKDVYVEKPISFTVMEGRRMVEAARKYGRIVQAGQNLRSSAEVRAMVGVLNEGQLGRVYRAQVNITKPRGSIGRTPESPVPPGVHWDLYLGPTPYRPFSLNRFHYGWHFFWDTSTTDIGNTGVHHLDLARWGLGKRVHPTKISSGGGFYIWDAEQQTPNFQTATIEYADGSIIDMAVNNVYGPSSPWNVFYTTQGYVSGSNETSKWETVRGTFAPRQREASGSGISEAATNASFPAASYAPGPPIDSTREHPVSQFQNFIDCVRSRKQENLYCDVLEGHMSATLCHLSNIAYRTGRKLVFNPETERFVGDQEADRYLTRQYRAGYVVPEKV
jgi:predicted dehydrogenase